MQAERDALISQTAKWFAHETPKGIKSLDDLYCADRPNYGGGIALFSFLALDTLRTLIEMGYANVDNQQRRAPSTAEFVQFMTDHPGFTASGYVVEAARDDCRVAITGLDIRGDHPPEYIAALRKFSKYSEKAVFVQGKLSVSW